MSQAQKITAFGFQFDANLVAPAAPMEAVPSGWYSVIITDGEMKPTGAGDGKRMNLEWTITEGPFKGRKIFDGLNLVNPSAQAQQISQGHLSAICHAVGVYQVADVQQLYNKPHQIKVDVEGERWVDADGAAVEPNTPGATRYEPKNRFKGAKAGSAPVGAAGGVSAGNTGLPQPGWAVPNGGQPAGTNVSATPAPTNAAAPAANPAQSPSKPGRKGGKPGQKAAAAPATPVVRSFWVGLDGPTYARPIAEAVIVSWLAKGMPPTTPLLLDTEPEGTEYKTAAAYGIGAPPATPPAAAPTADNPPPWTA